VREETTTEYIKRRKAEILARRGPLAPEVLIKLAPTDELAQAAATTRAALESGRLSGGDAIVAQDYLDKIERVLAERKMKADWERFWRERGKDTGLGGVEV